jgi:uncharacterized protein YjbI with pentapeptide repeats
MPKRTVTSHIPEHRTNTPVDWARKIANEAPDFRGAALEEADFSGVDLAEQDFRRAILRKATFIGCNLSNANFVDADLSGANFRGARLDNADFSNANLSRANFYQASLLGTALIGSNLFSTIFREATMGQTTFANLDMETCIGLEIRLCDMKTLQKWQCFDADSGRDIAEEIREYFMPDFSSWQDPNSFEESFKKLTADLRLEGVQLSSTEPQIPLSNPPHHYGRL